MERKSSKRKRKKRLIKQIEGQIRQKKKHENKLELGEFRKDTTPAYWKKEIEQFEKEEQRKKDLLKKLEKK